MVSLRLSGSVLVLWIRDEATGQSSNVGHESGYELTGFVLSWQPVQHRSNPSSGVMPQISLPPELLAMFPVVSHVDLNDLPNGYRLFGSNDEPISSFQVGRSYTVDLAGDEMCSS